MEQFVTTLVNWVVLPSTNVIVFLVTSGIAFVAFALLWAGFGAALIWSQGSLDAAWQWVRALPLLVQALVWLLFLPVVIGLWVWETTWPLIVRLVVILGLAGWNLMTFLPRAAQTARP